MTRMRLVLARAKISCKRRVFMMDKSTPEKKCQPMPPAGKVRSIQVKILGELDLCVTDFCLEWLINPEYEGEINSRSSR